MIYSMIQQYIIEYTIESMSKIYNIVKYIIR